ncbi:MAG: aminoacyl-tRNA hydrolase [Pseudomonadota bacterium]
MSAIALIVGLGNPGPTYAATRHNVGQRWVETLADRFRIPLQPESKFSGLVGRGRIAQNDVRLLVPTTYMNDSGRAVAALANFYKWTPDRILVAYDEMAFEPGQVRLREGGGDNGHNGVRSIVAGLGRQKGFLRLRIGVGHPGDARRVTSYLTQQKPPQSERELIEQGLDRINDALLGKILGGAIGEAMNTLHGPPGGRPASKRRSPDSPAGQASEQASAPEHRSTDSRE